MKPKIAIAISNRMYEASPIRKKDAHYIMDKSGLTVEALARFAPDYVFFPHWSHIIPEEIYSNFNCVIFHMTDLPFGRGGSPLQNLIARKIYKTRISAIKCVKTLDGGGVYLKRDFDISRGSAAELYLKAADIMSEMIDEIVRSRPEPSPQEGEVVEFRRRRPEESDISGLSDAGDAYDYIRMLDAPGYPRAFMESGGLRYEFFGVEKKPGGGLVAKVEITEKR